MQQHIDNIQYQDDYYQSINQQLKSEAQLQQVDHSDLQLFQYQLNFQQTLQYLLSILNYLLNQNQSQTIEFYSNPTIKIKCYSQKQIFTFQTFKHKIQLRKFQSFLDQFNYYFQNPLLFDSQTDQIQQILKQYVQPDEIEFQNSVRNLYDKLICYLDLKEYLKQELLYDIKDQNSPFAYKLNKCNFSICFNDNIIKEPNGPGFLPVLQKMQGYKGFGNLFMINVGSDEWEVAQLHNCKYEILLIFKKLSKASLHLYEQQMNFRSISKNQIIKFHNSYRILFHNVEKSTLTRYIDHYNHFICLYKQFLQDNQLDNSMAKQICNSFVPFIKFVKNLTQQLNQVNQSKGNILDMEHIINNIIQETDGYLCKLEFSDQVKKQIYNLLQYYLGIDAINTQNDLEQSEISIIKQLESEVVIQLQNRLNYFIYSNFLIKELNSNGSQSNIYYCENKFTGRKFALARPKQNYDYSELQLSIQKINFRIPKNDRKQIVKIYAVGGSSMWMEYSNTGNLQNYLTNRQLETFEALLICQQISQILLKLHENSLYHLDVKLENFLIFKKYGVNRIKVCDFGSMTDEKQFTFNMAKHRLLYSPPEAKENGLINSEKFDIWQLGQLFTQMKLNLEYPFLFNWLKHHNPQQRKSIREVFDQIGIYIENLMNNYIEYKLAWKCQVYFNEFEEELDYDLITAEQQFLDKVNYKTTYKRKDDGQIFKISQFNQKIDWGFLFNKYLQIYDIESSNNNWTQFCLFRKTSNIQNRINKQCWSLNQKTLYLNGLLKDLFSINYFQQGDHFYNQSYRKQPNSEESEEGQQFQNMRKLFLKEAQNHALFLYQKLNQENSEQQKKEDKLFIIKITIFSSLIIDILSHASKQNRFFLELKEIVKKIIYRKVSIVNKNSYLCSIQSLLFNMHDFRQQLQFKFLNRKIVRLKGFLYLVDDDVTKYYLRMTIEVANFGLDHVYLELSQMNFPFQSIINFKKFNVENFELFKLDFETNLCPYMKYVSQQMILNYKGKNMIDSPFNLVEGVFIDKRSRCFIKNDIFFIDKNLDEQVNLIRYFVLVIQQQLEIIGSCTFTQKLDDRLRQLQNESKDDQLDQQNQIHLIKSLNKMNDMRNIWRLQQQLELIYFIQDLWNFDLVNLLIVCNNLKDNTNYFQEYVATQKQEYMRINQQSNFQYYISIDNAMNASKIYQVYISSQLIPVIIYQQKQSKIIESKQKRIVIDCFRSVSFASKASKLKNKNSTQTKQIQEIFQFNVYLETSSIQINQICGKIKSFSLFEWVYLIQCLTSNYDVYGQYYQYLKTFFGKNLIVKLLVLIRCSDVLELKKNQVIQDILLYFKLKNELMYLQHILNIFSYIYNQNIIKISKNMIQMGMQILNINYKNFSLINYLFQKQFTEKQQNLIVYLSYFLIINQQYEKDIYYDLLEEKIYPFQKQNSFHFKYRLLYNDGQLNKDLLYQLLCFLITNFSSYRLQSLQNQINFIMNQYDIQASLEQQGFEIIQKLCYINPERIYIVKNKQSKDQQKYLCCYHLGQFYLNYDNFQVVQNQNLYEYHCQTMVKMDGQLIRIKQIATKNIEILHQIIKRILNLAEILFKQGYQFDIKEENLVLVLCYHIIIVYPVQIKKIQDSFEDIEMQIESFQQEIQINIVKLGQQQNQKFIKQKLEDESSEISTDESNYQYLPQLKQQI